jgi:hypothetical protein
MLNVTVPFVTDPEPGALTDTVAVYVTVSPTTGVVSEAETVVVVLAWPTVTVVVEDVLPLKLLGELSPL